MSSFASGCNRFQTKNGYKSGRNCKKVSTACDACRSAKSRCDAGLPCKRCQDKLRVCSYSEQIDRRRSGVGRQQRDELRDEADLLNTLLYAIRCSEHDRISQLIRFTDSEYTLDDIKTSLRQYFHVVNHPQPENFQFALTNHYITESYLPDHDLLRNASVSSWTNVTQDDQLISHLILLWLTWTKSWCDWVNQDLFLRDMVLGKGSTQYCSALLVNAILAWVTSKWLHNEAEAASDANSDLMNAFTAETIYHFEQNDMSAPNLSIAQGLTFLSLALELSGQSWLGHFYMGQSVALCVGFAENPPTTQHVDEQEELSRTVNKACRGILNMTSTSTLSIPKPLGTLAPQAYKSPCL